MARYGKLLLQRLTFQFCDRMGSSQGMREYLVQHLPAFKRRNPHVEVAQVQKRNRFPLVKAEYAMLPANAVHLYRQLQKQKQQLQQTPQQRRSTADPPTADPPELGAAGSFEASAPDREEAQQQQQKQKQQQQQQQPRLSSNVVGVKHRSAAEIGEVVWWLSQSQGRPKTRRVPGKHIVSRSPSIQGPWTASMFAAPQSP